MTALRAGVIGLGSMGRHHVRVLRSLPGVELVALADAYGDPHGLAQGLPVHADVESFVRAELDLAVVAVPTQEHHTIGLALAEAGVHTLIEKPLAVDAETGRRLVEAFDARGLVGAVGHIERFNPALQEMRRRIADGQLGQIYQVATQRQGPFPGRIADVGVVKDLATHDIDLTAWVTQSAYLRVAAQTAHRSDRAHEDLVVISGELEDSIVANHIVNWLSPLKARTTTVTGERGTFVADTLSADLTFFANGTTVNEWDTITTFRGISEGDVIRYALSKREPLTVEHEAFRDAVLGARRGTGPGEAIVTLSEGLRTLEVAEAALSSAASGETVALVGAPSHA